MHETSLRVLLIEDNPPDAELLAEMLNGQEEDFQFVRAECMAQAERQLQQLPAVDVILLDLGLPDSDGLESLERATNCAGHLPIIVLTGLEDEALGVEAVRKGAQDYLVKGQTAPRTLVRVVRHAVERKRLEESLRRLHELAERRAVEAQAANEAKSRFLANVSHELRTPMNAILGMVDLVLRKELDPTTRDCLNTARESADVLLTLLNDLLDSAKIESGNLELESAPLRLRRIMDQVTRSLSIRASEKGLALDCRIAANVPDALVGDEVRLRQVLLNLAGNAIKFTERGEVTMRVRVVEPADERPEVRERGLEESDDRTTVARSAVPAIDPQTPMLSATLEFSVRDTGIGIPPDSLARIFKPFAQADSSTARRFGGTGLGLSISANLIAMMGGRIWAESEPGRGSTFYFTVCLPLDNEPPPGRQPALDVAAGPTRKLRILLVEDNPANQKVATYILQEAGHTIEVARDGRQAIGMCECERYDVILMDVQLPGMDGVETTAAIRAQESAGKYRQAPIIALTAHAMGGDRERFLAAGMDGYLTKPIEPSELLAEIDNLTALAPQARSDAAGRPTVATATGQRPVVAFDYPVALERCCQSRQMLGEMVGYLFEEADSLFPKMHAALERGDIEEVARLGHRLKGTLLCLAAEPATAAAAAIERSGNGDSQAATQEALKRLEQAVNDLKKAVADYRPRDAGKDT